MKKKEKKFIRELRENSVVASNNDKTRNMLNALNDKTKEEAKKQEADKNA